MGHNSPESKEEEERKEERQKQRETPPHMTPRRNADSGNAPGGTSAPPLQRSFRNKMPQKLKDKRENQPIMKTPKQTARSSPPDPDDSSSSSEEEHKKPLPTYKKRKGKIK